MSDQAHTIVGRTLIIGMEIHVELATRRKVFAHAPSPAVEEFEDAEPNTLIDPVTLGLPGALPVLNERAVELSARVGLALGCQIAERTKWDRKSYFYPDLPKGYQISQYDLPVCFDGSYDLFDEAGELTRRIGIVRAHLEEDAGKLMHEAPGGGAIPHSIVDLNRAGAALLEIVTAPDFRSAAECEQFSRELRDLCRTVGATLGDMQKGHMRFEPNINMELELADGTTVRTPVVEVKNLNSFRAVRDAIVYEEKHQPTRFLETGRVMGPGAKDTRGWDDARGVTLTQREKEDAHDYRYFPDPDLTPVVLTREWVERVRASLPEKPAERTRRYIDTLGLKDKEARALVAEVDVADFADACLGCVDELAPTGDSSADAIEARKVAVNMVLQTGFRLSNERGAPVPELGVSAQQVAGIALMRVAGDVGSSQADKLFEAMCNSDESPRDAAERLGLLQVSDAGALEAWCAEVLADPANAKAVEDLRAGKQQAVGRLIGAVMQKSSGTADAKLVREQLIKMTSG